MGKLILTGRGRRRVLGGHPWIYRDDVAAGEADVGELVPVLAPDEKPLGWGLHSAASKICVRLVTRDAVQPTSDFWRARVRRAIDARRRVGLLGADQPNAACRLIGGDADGLPGFVVDRYADVLVIQSGCQGSDRMRDFLLELVLAEAPFDVAHVLDRSDARVRRLEDLEPRVEWLRGEALEPVVVEERSPHAATMLYEVDVLEGHKTGHYLDQRSNRIRASHFADGARVLDAFSYDGLFGIRAALAGAKEVLCLDQSEACGERVLRNAERNGVAGRVRFERGNAMHDLRRRAKEGERYELVVIDPPAFARNKREAEGAARGYRELNLRAFALLAPAGWLVTCSCSYNVRPERFLDYVAQAARDAGVDAWLHESSGASPDHPALLSVPETSYLKCAIVRT